MARGELPGFDVVTASNGTRHFALRRRSDDLDNMLVSQRLRTSKQLVVA
jgi:hypothetical protein